jgi:hypothetical protein
LEIAVTRRLIIFTCVLASLLFPSMKSFAASANDAGLAARAWTRIAQNDDLDAARKRNEKAANHLQQAIRKRQRAEADMACKLAVLTLSAKMMALLNGNAPFRNAAIKHRNAKTMAAFCKDNNRVLAGLDGLQVAFIKRLNEDTGTCRMHTAWLDYAETLARVSKVAVEYRDGVCVKTENRGKQ